jgi:hypothetical protein
LFHHDPDRTDDQVAAIEHAWRDAPDIAVEAAREGMAIDLLVPAHRAKRTADR